MGVPSADIASELPRAQFPTGTAAVNVYPHQLLFSWLIQLGVDWLAPHHQERRDTVSSDKNRCLWPHAHNSPDAHSSDYLTCAGRSSDEQAPLLRQRQRRNRKLFLLGVIWIDKRPVLFIPV
jgi:hypothetical protein